MKKVIFMFVLLLSATILYAQQGKGKGPKKDMTPEEKADKYTGRLKSELNLTDDQIPKVKQATLTRINQMNTVREKAKAAEDKKAFREERRKIFQSWEAEMKTILTTDQYTTYLVKKEERKKRMQERKAAKKGETAPATDELDDSELLDELE